MNKNFENALFVIVTVALLALAVWVVVESFDPDCPSGLSRFAKVTGFAFLIVYPYFVGRAVESAEDE